jgi:PhnB protein
MTEQRAELFDQALQAMLDGKAPGDGFGEELELCALLRDLPKGTPMNITVNSVMPMILVDQPTKFGEFLVRAFGASVTGSEARVGNGSIRIGTGNMAASLHYFVDDVDAAYRQAIAAGASVLMGTAGEPADRPYGERSAFVQDPFGNQWFLGKHLRPDGEKADALNPHLNPSSGRGMIAFLEAAFGAKTLGVYEHEGKVMHAAVMLGDSTVEMGESGRLPMALAVAAADPKAVRARALAAGAIAGPGNAVADPFGNHWYFGQL